MNIPDILATAFAMPLTSPAFPRGPYLFTKREFLVITYRTDVDALRAVVPEPLQVREPLVKFEFIRMPDSTGFGDYTESGQVIPVHLDGVRGSYVHAMYLNDHPPIAGGARAMGFSEKAGQPQVRNRNRHAGGHAGLRAGSHCQGHHGLQTPGGRAGKRARVYGRAQLFAEDHPACGRNTTHL